MKGVIATSDFEPLACCRGMYNGLIDKEFEYDKTFNCYYVHLYNHWQTLAYCPYCGAKMPDLIFEYDDALEEALGKEFCDITEDEIPEEFKTDEWWKKRGL